MSLSGAWWYVMMVAAEENCITDGENKDKSNNKGHHNGCTTKVYAQQS